MPSPQLTRAPAARFSVVVPTRDTRELTLSCLAAVGQADPPPHEVVVVDDGSTDGTAEAALARSPEVRALRQPRALGFTAAVNRGIEESGGDFLLLLNSDTEIPPDTFARLDAAFAAHPRLGVLGAALYYPDGSPQWSGGPAPGTAWLLSLASGVPALLDRVPGYRLLHPLEGDRRRVEWVSGAAMAVRRTVWQEVGAMDERFAFYCQDLDFCLRAKRRGWGVAVLSGWNVVHHHGATITGDNGKREDLCLLWPDLVRLAAKHGGAVGARRAARALQIGGRLQRLARRARLGVASSAQRGRLLRELSALDAALAALPGAVGSLGPLGDL